MKKIQKRSPAEPQTVVKQASLTDSCKVKLGNARNGRKPYQFKPGNKFGSKYRWRPGQCGNPNGRPSENRGIKAITREFGEQYNPKMGKTRDEHLMELLYRKGCQGNLKAAEIWLNYRWGRPTTPLEHSGGIDLSRVIADARRRDADEVLPALTDARGGTQAPQVATEISRQGADHEDDEEQAVIPPASIKRVVM